MVKKYKKMKEDTEFQEIGREIPYKVPEGFFEKISEKTLLLAKQRERKSRKIVIALRTFAVAASFLVLALLSYFMIEKEKPIITSTVGQKQTEVKATIRPPEVTDKQIAITGTKKIAPEKTVKKEIFPEEFTDVLSELSDDELLQLASVYKSDPFIEESQP
jgi:hypothetical protein